MGMTRPLGRTWGVALATCAAAMLLVFAGSASAANFCVGTLPADCPAPATEYFGDGGGLDQAIGDSIANGSGTEDKIYIGSGTYTSLTGFDGAGSRIQLIGTGATKPILTVLSGPGADNTSVFSSSNAFIKLSGLAIKLPPATASTGVSATQGGTFTNLAITAPDAIDATGINVQGSFPEIISSSIDLPVGDSNSVGVRAASAGSLGAYDVHITGADYAFDVSDSNTITINRAVLSTPHGVKLTDSPGAIISSSLIKPAGSPFAGDYSVAVYNSNGNVQAPVGVYNCTLVGGGASNGTIGVIASNSQTSGEVNVALDSTVVYAHDTAIETFETGAGNAQVNLTYSRYGGAITGPGSVSAAGQLLSGDPGFADAPGGNYSLVKNSQFVDAGDPAPIPGSSDSDVNGNPRIVSRGGGNVRDIGAYEVQNAAPDAKIQILTAVPSTTSPIAFSAASSTDADGDPMSYAWKFDASSFASGVAVNKMITIDGPHTVELTVTDQTGVATTVAAQFSVARGFLALKIKSQNVRMDSRGRFAVTMSCPDAAASNCTGRLIFETTKKIEAKRYQGRSSKAKILRAANYVFSIEPGTTRKLSVRTYGTFQNVLKKHKKFVLVAKMVSGSTANATLTSNRPTFTLSAPKAKKKR